MNERIPEAGTQGDGRRRLMILTEVADLLRISPHTVRSFVRKGKLHPVRICRRLLFDPADIENLISIAKGKGESNDEN